MRLHILGVLVLAVSSAMAQMNPIMQVPSWYQTIMDGCFFRGRQSVDMRNNYNCSLLDIDLLWEKGLNEQCKNMFEQGCAYALAERNCNRGTDHAHQLGICEAFPPLPSHIPLAYQRRCCDVCATAMRRYERDNTCPVASHPPIFGMSSPMLNNMMPSNPSIQPLTSSSLNFEHQVTIMLDSTYSNCCSVHRDRIILRQVGAANEFFVNKETQFVDRCQTGNVCQHLCVDSGETTVQCSCNEGFDLAENGRDCIDRDECALNLCPQDHRCENTLGSYKCITLSTKRDSLQNGQKSESLSDLEDVTNKRNVNLTENANKVTTHMENRILTKTIDNQLQNTTPKTSQIGMKTRDQECFGGYFDPYMNACQNIQNNTIRNIDSYDSYCDAGQCQSEVKDSVTNHNCSLGFQWNKQFEVCEDVDECAGQAVNSVCSVGLSCINRKGSHECLNLTLSSDFKCDPEYVKEGNECLDIDECMENNLACKENQTCVNLIGSFLCMNQKSASLSQIIQMPTTTEVYSGTSTQESTDIQINYFVTSTALPDVENHIFHSTSIDNQNITEKSSDEFRHLNSEKEINNQTSIATQTADVKSVLNNVIKKQAQNEMTGNESERQTISNSQAEEELSLLKSWTNFGDLFSGETSTSSQKVACQKTSCAQDHSCSVQDNQIHCKPRCEQGQTFDIIEETCKIDYCSTCPYGHECIVSSNNNVTCLTPCPNGFVRSRFNSTLQKECMDIDECAGINQCNPLHSRCVNTNGSYTCECLNGFEHSTSNDKWTCTRVKKCSANSCQSGECHEVMSGFECRCPTGLLEEEGKCKKVDECKDCPGICKNHERVHSCHICPIGFKITDKEKGSQHVVTCGRVNNCNKNSCPPGHQCTSMKKGYHCTEIQCPMQYVPYTNQSSICLLERSKFSKKYLKQKPYALSHRIMVLPDDYKPKQDQPKYIYLMKNDQNRNKTKYYSHNLTPSDKAQFSSVQENFALEKQSNGDLALNLVKPIAGPAKISLNVDLIYRQRILHRTIVHVYVDEKF